MRNTESGGNTDSTTSFSSRADSRSWPNGFSITTRRHLSVVLPARPALAAAGHLRERLRRDRQVERVVAQRAALRVELLDVGLQPLERLVVVELALHEADALRELLPHVLVERGAGVLLHRVVDDLREVLVVPVAPGEADQGEARRQQPAVGEVVHGRHELLAGQVPGHPEDDQRDGPAIRFSRRSGGIRSGLPLRGDLYRGHAGACPGSGDGVEQRRDARGRGRVR